MAGLNHEAVKVHGEKGTSAEWNADHKQTGNHDCEQYQHLNHVWENRNDWPAGPVAGQVIYRTDFNNAFFWNGTAWQSLQSVATVIVAADGSGHFTDIQDGIDALPAGGGVVYIKEGTYTITVALTRAINNVALKGAGKATIINSTVAIISLDIANQSGWLIDSIYFHTTAGPHGIHFDTVTDSFITRCWFDGFDEAVFIENSSDYNTITDNHMFLNDGQGIFFDDANSNIVTGNIIWDNSGTAIYIYGNNNVLTNNICYSNVEDGIECDGDFNLIQGNQVYDNGDGGIFGTGIKIGGAGDRNIVTGNYVRGNFTAQITDNGTNTLPNGAMGTNNLALDDHNIVA